ncbi:MAG TPA: ammonium transporter [Candidatus Limnocylindrales bacterium]
MILTGHPIDSGDTAWVLMSIALVMLMTPGLALFYGGLVRRKNVLSTIMQSIFILALVSVTWVLFGFTLAFGKDAVSFDLPFTIPGFGNHVSGLIGGLDFLGLRGIGKDPISYAPTIPASAFMAFQMMFAIITPALITGAFAERKKFKAFVLFSLLWTLFVYSPIAHWVWGDGGWLGASGIGALDYAGGTVVHISSGVAALVAALVLGPRVRRLSERFEPHDVRLAVIGAGLLWFGWFGFNGGSALGANGAAANAIVVTNTAAGMAALTWVTVSWLHKGTPSVVGAISGAVAGLVAITPASGFVDASAAIIIGMAAGAVCYGAIILREHMKVDDALDVWAVHGVGGTLGAILTGVFAVAAVGGASGLIDNNGNQVVKQVIAVAATWIYSGIVTFIILKVVDRFVGLRVEESEEEAGLDSSQHGEVAWQAE